MTTNWIFLHRSWDNFQACSADPEPGTLNVFLQGPKPRSELNLGNKTCIKMISCWQKHGRFG